MHCSTHNKVQLFQVQVGATGSREAEERARAVALLGLDDTGQIRANTQRTLLEDDLAMFLAYQRSRGGREAQAALTAASFKLATRVGRQRNDGGLTSNVFERLGHNLLQRPGLWLLRFPLTAARLSGVGTDAHCAMMLPGLLRVS